MLYICVQKGDGNLKKKIQTALRPGRAAFYVLFLLFAACGLYFSKPYGFIGMAIVIILRMVAIRSDAERRQRVYDLMENIEIEGGEIRPAVTKSPLPTVVALATTGQIIWANEAFADMTGHFAHAPHMRLTELAPTFETRWLIEGKTAFPGELRMGRGIYHVFGSMIQSGAGQMMMLHFIDCTEFVHLRDDSETRRPAIAVIAIDNYEELVKNTTDSEKSSILAGIDRRLSSWVKDSSAVMRKYDRDKYIFIIENAELDKLAAKKFSVLQEVRDIQNHEGVVATLSIGIGRDGETLAESYKYAGLAIDMALSRGGDQAVIKNRYSFEFFGGLSEEVEKRTKVKTRIVAQALSELIASSKNVILMGHRFADMDCFGAAVALHKAVTQMGKPAWIAIDPDRNMVDLLYRRVAENGYREYLKAPSELMDVVEEGTLLIVVDTHSKTIIESRELYEKCRSVAVIDHHRKLVEYIDNATIFYHEPYASSACEMVTELVQYLSGNIRLTRLEAEALLAGIMLDTKNFVSKAGVRTFEAAAYLRRLGAETSDVRKYFNTSLSDYQQRIKLMASAELYHGCAVASTNQMIEDINVVAAQAADELLNINGVAASFVMYETGRGVNFSARSMGEMNVQIIMESLGGGGHLTMAGAQLSDCTLESARQRLFEAIDDYLSKNPRPAK